MPNADLYPNLHGIPNFRAVSDRLATAGQPSAEQFALIRDAGFESVINLAQEYPASPGALPDEDLIVDELGLSYVHIPVRWLEPTRANLKAFFHEIDARALQRLFVHCIANKRVSAFLYLHSVIKRGESESTARADMHAIWTPNEVWQPFLDAILADPSGL